MQAPLTALLWCNDDHSLDVIDRTFEEYSVSTYICMSSESARTSADQRKFDLLMLDFDEPEAEQLVDFRAVDLWGYPSVVIALATNPATVRQALGKRVHFVLQKPFTGELLGRTLKAGYSLIVNEKRTAFRHTVCIPADASFLENNSKSPLENASVQDISLTGICLQTDNLVPKDATVFVDFVSPPSHARISIIGKVMWSDDRGRAGIQFRFIPPLEQERLRGWLSTCCPWDVELRPKSFANNNLKAVAVPKRIQ
jgi:hypothetical protein